MMKIWKNETFDHGTVVVKFWIFLWLITGADCTKGDAEREFTVQTGGSVTVPCHYDRKYIQHKKYWCYHVNGIYNYCSILSYANETKGKVSVMDYPDQSLFTVTMRNLQNQNTGIYWCVVEIEGILHMDVTERLYFTIQSVPDVTLVSGDDDALTTDTGSTTVSINETSIPNNSGQTSSSKDQQNIHPYSRLMMWHLLIVLLLMLMLLIAVATAMLRKKHKRNNTHITHGEGDKAGDADDCDVIYSSVIKLHKNKACRPVCEEKDVIYSSVCKQVSDLD